MRTVLVDLQMLLMLSYSGLMLGLNYQYDNQGMVGDIPHAEISLIFVSRTRPPWIISPRT
jgi:hypothetical protein